MTICVAPHSQHRGHWFSNRYLSNAFCMSRLVLSARDTALNKIIELSALLELMGYWGHGQSMCKTMICGKSNTAMCPRWLEGLSEAGRTRRGWLGEGLGRVWEAGGTNPAEALGVGK